MPTASLTNAEQERIFKSGKPRREAADYLREKFGQGSASALAKAASSPDGPAHYKFGKKVLYLDADLDAWALGRLRRVEPKNSLQAAGAT